MTRLNPSTDFLSGSASGWLRSTLQTQGSSGLTGTIPKFWDLVNESSWILPGSTGGADDAGDGLHESLPYWLNGAVSVVISTAEEAGVGKESGAVVEKHWCCDDHEKAAQEQLVRHSSLVRGISKPADHDDEVRGLSLSSEKNYRSIETPLESSWFVVDSISDFQNQIFRAEPRCHLVQTINCYIRKVLENQRDTIYAGWDTHRKLQNQFQGRNNFESNSGARTFLGKTHSHEFQVTCQSKRANKCEPHVSNGFWGRNSTRECPCGSSTGVDANLGLGNDEHTMDSQSEPKAPPPGWLGPLLLEKDPSDYWSRFPFLLAMMQYADNWRQFALAETLRGDPPRGHPSTGDPHVGNTNRGFEPQATPITKVEIITSMLWFLSSMKEWLAVYPLNFGDWPWGHYRIHELIIVIMWLVRQLPVALSDSDAASGGMSVSDFDSTVTDRVWNKKDLWRVMQRFVEVEDVRHPTLGTGACDYNRLFDCGANSSKQQDAAVAANLIARTRNELLSFAEKLMNDGFDWNEHWSDDATNAAQLALHGVNNAMAIKWFAVKWQLQRTISLCEFESQRSVLCESQSARAMSEADLENLLLGYRTLNARHGQLNGMFTCDEIVGEPHANRGTELCSVVETLYSLAVMIETLMGEFMRVRESVTPRNGGGRRGKVKRSENPVPRTALLSHVAQLANNFEKIALNALFGSLSSDFKTHPYLQFANGFQAKEKTAPHIWPNDGADAAMYGFTPNFECCTANFHQGFGKLATRAWWIDCDSFQMRSSEMQNLNQQELGIVRPELFSLLLIPSTISHDNLSEFGESSVMASGYDREKRSANIVKIFERVTLDTLYPVENRLEYTFVELRRSVALMVKCPEDAVAIARVGVSHDEQSTIPCISGFARIPITYPLRERDDENAEESMGIDVKVTLRFQYSAPTTIARLSCSASEASSQPLAITGNLPVSSGLGAISCFSSQFSAEHLGLRCVFSPNDDLAASLQWRNLVFSLDLEEKATTLRTYARGCSRDDNIIAGKPAWRYALALFPKDAEEAIFDTKAQAQLFPKIVDTNLDEGSAHFLSCEQQQHCETALQRDLVASQIPFFCHLYVDVLAVKLSASEWPTTAGGSAPGNVPPSPLLLQEERKFFGKAHSPKLEVARLRPYGCQRIRITAMPWVRLSQ